MARFGIKAHQVVKFALLSLFALAGCSTGGKVDSTPAVMEVTRMVEKTVMVTQIVEIEKVVTATPEKIEPQPTQSQSSDQAVTPAPAGGIGMPFEGVSGWCTPKTVFSPAAEIALTGSMPAGAYPIQKVNGQKEAIIEVQSCTFVYTFAEGFPEGVKLEMYDQNKTPFFRGALVPVTQDKTKGFITVLHPYVINPPFWQIPYRLDLVSANGKVLETEEVVFKRGWTPKVCYDGMWPNPVTLECKVPGEAHPWDPWYGTDKPYEPTPVDKE